MTSLGFHKEYTFSREAVIGLRLASMSHDQPWPIAVNYWFLHIIATANHQDHQMKLINQHYDRQLSAEYWEWDWLSSNLTHQKASEPKTSTIMRWSMCNWCYQLRGSEMRPATCFLLVILKPFLWIISNQTCSTAEKFIINQPLSTGTIARHQTWFRHHDWPLN